MSESTPVIEDANATAVQLLQRAAADWAAAEARREQQAREDHVNGQQGGTQ